MNKKKFSVLNFLPYSIAFAFSAAFSTYTYQTKIAPLSFTLIFAVISFLAMIASFHLYKLCRKVWNPMSAWATLTLLWALVFMGFASITNDCLNTRTPQPCTPRETIEWGTTGASLIILVILLAYLPYRFFTGGFRIGKKIKNRHHVTVEEKNESTSSPSQKAISKKIPQDRLMSTKLSKKHQPK